MGKKIKFVLSVGAAGATAWAASKVMVHPTPRSTKRALTFKTPIVIQQLSHFANIEKQTTNAAFLGVHGLAMDVKLTSDEEIIIVTEQETETAQRSLKSLLADYPHFLFVVRLIDSPDTYEGSLMPSKLWKLLEESDAQDQVAVLSPYDEQVDRFNLYTQHRAAVGAGNEELKKAYMAYSSGFGHLYHPRTDFFVLSGKIGSFQQVSEGFIKFLKKLNIFVYIELVEIDSITQLVEAGVDGFIYDAPNVIIKHLDTLLEK